MVDEKVFDYNEYIQERLGEIEDLEERRFAKQILLDGLANIFTLSEQRYHELENRIQNEIEIPWNHYEIITTVTEKSKYDPIHDWLFPICEEERHTNSMTVYLAADDNQCQEFLTKDMIYAVTEEGKSIPFQIIKCRRYEEALQNLYQLFCYNQIPWHTVHTGYLERFFDLVPMEDMEEEQALTFQWEEWEPYVQQDKILLWNIRESKVETGQFMTPSIDNIFYEHVFALTGSEKGKYLIGADEAIEEVRYEENSIILKSKIALLKDIRMYQICKKQTEEKTDIPKGYLPLLSNRKKDSFAGRYLYKTGNFLQTEGELRRKIEECSGDHLVSFWQYRIVSKVKAPVVPADMNVFIKEEVFPREQRKILLFCFEKEGESNYLSVSHIRYLLSELQLEYFEYKCVGIILDKEVDIDELCVGDTTAGRL